MSERDATPRGGNVPIKMNPKTVVLVVIVVIVLISILSSFYVVDQTEKAVVLRFGKYYQTAQPGLNFKLPFGIDKNFNVPTEVVQNMQFGFRTEKAGISSVYSNRDYPQESVMLTGDLNIVDVEWIIQFKIVDPQAWLFHVEERERTIRDISQSVINLLVGDIGILDVIGSERENIQVEAKTRMNDIFNDYGLGIDIKEVQLANSTPPEGLVSDAFEDVNKAIQDMNRFINEGKEEYNSVIPKARGEADKMIQVAQGYAAERVNEARGDVARFLSVKNEYDKNPEITRTRLYLETMEEVFSGAEGTDLIDKSIESLVPIKMLQGGVQ